MFQNKYLVKVYICFIFLSFICSMYPWFVWNNKLTPAINILTAIIAVINLFNIEREKTEIPLFIYIALVLLSLWEYHNYNINGQIFAASNLLNLLILLSRNHLFKEMVLKELTKFTAILLAISLIAYIIYIIGLYPISPKEIFFDDNRYISQNYYFFITPLTIDFIDYIRFRSIFMEPGHMCLGTTLLLFASKFNLKNKYVLTIFIVNLFSLSLASYATMFLGFILLNITPKKQKFLFCCLALIPLCLFLFSSNVFSKIFDHYLWDRLEYSEETGTFVGYNRTTAKYNRIYEETISHTETLIWGDPSINSDQYGGNAGYKRYIVTNGILGIFLTLILYLSAPILFRNYKLAVYSLITIILLWQDSYPLWLCVITPYILSLASLQDRNKYYIKYENTLYISQKCD